MLFCTYFLEPVFTGAPLTTTRAGRERGGFPALRRWQKSRTHRHRIKLKPGGHMLFFPRSFAWDRANDSAKDVVAEWEKSAGIERVGTFRSLLVYRKTA